jgi:apolipoprotein N-acyltransferase
LKVLLNNKLFVIYVVPFILGAATILSLPPYNFTIINFFSFSILLFLITVVKKKIEFKYRKKNLNYYFFYLGCSFGFGFFLFGNYWISISLTHDEAFKILIPIALILIPLFLSLFLGLAIFLVGPYAEKKISYIFLFSIIFSIFEFLRGNLLTGFPWNLISYTWSWSIETLQILAFIGTYSLSLISITFFCTPFLFIKNKIFKCNVLFSLILMFIFAINYFSGLYKISNSSFHYDKNISIKIVSPNFSLDDFKAQSDMDRLEKLIKISNPEKNKKTIFIWPEGIFYESNLQNIQDYKDLFIDKFSENHLIILGVNNFDKSKYYNSLVVLNYKLEIISIYNKIYLVPFGEFLPLEKILSNFGIKKITQGYNSFSPGKIRKEINLGSDFGNKKIIPLICYEIIYSGKIINKNQFPDLIINISEDAWFGDSIGPYQHFSKAVYRSIEEGLFIARSANQGISSFISPNGKVIKSLNLGEAGNLELNFPNYNHQTLFSYYGNKIFLLIIFLYIFLILIFKKLKTND